MKKNQIKKRNALIVLGMHRSGTSALAGSLKLLGLNFGDNFLPPNIDNITGFWENKDIYHIHEKLLHDLNSSWDDIRNFPDSWWNLETVQRHKLEIVSILEREFADSPFWGVKDPRLCRLLYLWRPILEQTGNIPFFLIIVRNPLEVAASLAKRNNFPKGKSCLLWLKHLVDAEKGTRYTTRLFTTYNEILSDWKGLLYRAEKNFGFKWPVNIETVDSEIDTFLEDNLHHHRVTDSVLIEDKDLARWIQDAYFAVNDAVYGKNGQMIDTLDGISAELNESEKLFQSVVSDFWDQNRQINRELHEQKRNFDQLKNCLEDISKTETVLKDKIHDNDVKIKALESEIFSLRDDLSKCAQNAEESEEKISHLQAELKERNRQIQQRGEQLSDALAKIANEKTKKNQLNSQIDALVKHGEEEKLYRQTILSSRSWKITAPLRWISANTRILRNKIKLSVFIFSRQYVAIKKSGLFDVAFYLDVNKDVADSGVDPIMHYLEAGANEGRNPNKFFSTSYYLAQNPDVAESKMNPLAHYIMFGAREGRDPGTFFNTAHYLEYNPDVAESGMNPLLRFIKYVTVKRKNFKSVCDTATKPYTHPHAVGSNIYDRSHWQKYEPDESELERQRQTTFDYEPQISILTPPYKTPEPYDNLCMTIPTSRKFKILYVDGVGVGSDFVSYRYRISNIREALTFVDVESEETNIFELSNNLQQLLDYDVLVLFRAGWNEALKKIVECCRALHIPVIFDLDDYVFEPAIATEEYISGIHKWTKKQKQEYLNGVKSYRQTLMECDYFIASTDYIAERAADLGKKVYVINNGLSQKLLELTSHLRVPKDDENSNIVEIVYMSGTQTHQDDFRTIVPALAKILEENDYVHLFVFGYLDLEEFGELLPFKERIRTQSFVEWDIIKDYVKQSHINIAPLEIGNPFCEAKSELKYFEGAAYGLVTVAAATNSFKKAIIDGQTGFICETDDEWYCALTNLVSDKDLRSRITQKAIKQATNRYHPINSAKQALMTYREIIQDYRTQHNIPEGSLSVSWLVPPPFHGSGGHNDIFIAANQMVKRGHQVTVYFTMMQLESHAPKAVKKYIEEHFGYAVLFNIVIGTRMLRSCDVLISTHYTTARIVAKMKNQVYMPVYFVQDFEPYFNPVGSEYFAAEFSYQCSNFFFITLGRWLAKVLTDKYGARAKFINFWVDRKDYYPPNGDRGNKSSTQTLIFFARPSMSRRCFTLGIEALAYFHKMMPQSEIILYGTNDLKNFNLGFPYRDMGVLTVKELGDLYRSADLGLLFSTTNPSLVIFEAMACGLPVVDLNVLDSYDRHGHDYPAFLVLPDPEIIANALSYLLKHPEKLSELSKKSLEFTDNLVSSEESLQHISLILEEELHAKNTKTMSRVS